MPPAASAHQSVPAELLADLRATRASDSRQRLDTWGLRPLAGGRNNDVFAWDAHDTCIKLYRRTDRHRVEREWHGLAHVAALGIAPRPLWHDSDPEHPALGMTLIADTPAAEHGFAPAALGLLARATRAMQELPLTGSLAALPRVDSVGHYIARLTDTWPAQLAEAPDDEHTPGMLALLHRWNSSTDRDLLARPDRPVFGRGDANLLNWLHPGDGTLRVVDFEFSGYSDQVVDAADHVEHISAHHLPDTAWHPHLDTLGVTHRNRLRFEAARRTIALRWLATLWRQRHRRVQEFLRQHDRVRRLMD